MDHLSLSSVRSLVSNLSMLGLLARDLPGFLRRPVTLHDAEARMRRRLAQREARFLAMVERAVYGYPKSPYRALLQYAGCELGDLRALVGREGVEGTLGVLAARGVYVTYDEMKGRSAAVRGSAAFHFSPSDFDNPRIRPHFAIQTGGSGGRPTRVLRTLPLIRELAEQTALVLDAHQIRSPRYVVWQPGPIGTMLLYAKLGQPIDAWLYQARPLPRTAHLAARAFRLAGRVGGYRFPLPVYQDADACEPLARWLAERAATGCTVIVRTITSSAVRVARSALDAGIGLAGVVFFVAGEPISEARRALMEASGARVIAFYGAVETPGIGYACASPAASDDVHLFHDRYALGRRRRTVGAGESAIDALLVTGLGPSESKICLNAELGDAAQVAVRPSDCCALGRRGLVTHLSDIRSFDKLTGEGVTFAQANLTQLLEVHLPRQFGGTGLDYQLVEEEATDLATRLVLRIHPGVGPVDESAVRAAVLDWLAAGGGTDRYMAGLWRALDTIIVRREPPAATGAWKVLPFHLARTSMRSRPRSDP